MANPSTVWTQLALPNPPAGGIPFVDIDNASIITDVLNFYFTNANSVLTGSEIVHQLTVLNGTRVAYTDASGTPGAQTINKTAGRVAIAVGASAVTITNSCCFATSLVFAQLETADATLNRIVVAKSAGSFTITGNANATGNVIVSWQIVNVF